MKGSQSTTYTITETDNLLSPKATTSYVDAQLLLKVNITDMIAALALKANQLTTYTKTETDNLLASKATTSYVDAQLLLKVNTSDMTAALARKATQQQLTPKLIMIVY